MGGQNTKWFHSKASQRRKRNRIEGVWDPGGEWIEGDESIGRVATEYFKDLFTSSNPCPLNSYNILDSLVPKVSNYQNSQLTRPFSKAKIEKAVKEMSPTKAPGRDGLQALFYQRYWEVVGEDTSNLCLQILNGGESVRSLNKTLISLIPKVQSPKKIQDFRPISLCNVSYKIIAKVLANRLKGILDSIISPSQSAFVPGRQISDNVFIGFECIHAINSRRKGNKGYVAMKLDMSKAYDRVEWSFVRKAMDRMGFDSRWINKVMYCVELVEYSILINGLPQENFTPERGIRQGDPLSLYLFLICAEGFSSILNREEFLSKFCGLRSNNYCPSISHLFFADDSLVFCRASEKDCRSVKEILKMYERASGQTINLEKSIFITSKNVKAEKVKEIREILEIKHTNFIR